MRSGPSRGRFAFQTRHRERIERERSDCPSRTRFEGDYETAAAEFERLQDEVQIGHDASRTKR